MRYRCGYRCALQVWLQMCVTGVVTDVVTGVVTHLYAVIEVEFVEAPRYNSETRSTNLVEPQPNFSAMLKSTSLPYEEAAILGKELRASLQAAVALRRRSPLGGT